MAYLTISGDSRWKSIASPTIRNLEHSPILNYQIWLDNEQMPSEGFAFGSQKGRIGCFSPKMFTSAFFSGNFWILHTRNTLFSVLYNSVLTVSRFWLKTFRFVCSICKKMEGSSTLIQQLQQLGIPDQKQIMLELHTQYPESLELTTAYTQLIEWIQRQPWWVDLLEVVTTFFAVVW